MATAPPTVPRRMCDARHRPASCATPEPSGCRGGVALRPRAALLFVGLALGILAPVSLPACDWFDLDWPTRKSITIDATQVSATLTDFPVLVSITDADLASDAQADGDDIVFTSSDATTQLDHEIERYDSATGTLVAWVKVPSVSSSSDTVLHLYYGNATAANQENASAVWSNGYAAVYHLHDDFLDATTNSRDGTNTSTVDTTGQIGDGQEFTPISSIDLGTWNPTSGDELTLQAWARYDDFDQDDPRVVTKAFGGGGEQDHVFMLGLGGTNESNPRFRIKTGTSDGSGTTTLLASTDDVVVSTWTFLAGTYDGATMTLYRNGTSVASTSKTGNLRQNAWSVLIGNHPGNSNTSSRAHDGAIDEVRISTVARSADWIATEHANQSSPGTFIAVGSEATQETTWSGATSSDWFDDTNWSIGTPTTTCDARIPTGLGTYPTLTAGGAGVRDLVIESGASLGIASFSLTATGDLDVDGTLTIGSGTVDLAGTFDATGGALTFSGAGRLQLGGALTSLGTLTEGTGTIEFDDTTAARTIPSENYHHLEIDTGGAVATTGGSITLSGDLSVTSGELEIDDGDAATIDGDVTVGGRLDLEPGTTLQLGASSAVTISSGGTFEARGTWSALALITTGGGSDRYSFSAAAGATVEIEYAYFRFMDASGIQITDSPSVTALTQLEQTIFDEGATGGRLLRITNNDDVVTLAALQFFDTNGDLTYNVETISATATITIDPYDNDANSAGFGGPEDENDNGAGKVTPGTIAWGATTPVLLRNFEARTRRGSVAVRWSTAAEWDIVGFRLERRPPGGSFASVGTPILARGASPDGAEYAFDDAGAARDAEYRLLLLDRHGGTHELARTAVTATRNRLAPAGTTGAVRYATPSASPTPVAPPTAGPTLSATSALSAPLPPGSTTEVIVEVVEAGATAVSAAALEDAGWDTSDPTDWRLVRRGVEIAIHPFAESTSPPRFGFAFIAAPESTPECTFDAYRLSADPNLGPGPRISPGIGGRVTSGGLAPRAVRDGWFERRIDADRLLVASTLLPVGRDRWYADLLVAPQVLPFSLDLPQLVDDGRAVPGEVELFAWSHDPLAPLDHRVFLRVNGVEVALFEGGAAGEIGGQFTISPGVLVRGENVVELEAIDLGVASVVFVGALRLVTREELHARDDRLTWQSDGARCVAISGFGAGDLEAWGTGPGGAWRVDLSCPPSFATGTFANPIDPRREITIDLPAPLGSAIEITTSASRRPPHRVRPIASPPVIPFSALDGCIVAPSAWIPLLDPLVALRASQGRSVAVIAWESIVDHFGGGRPTTAALDAFLDALASAGTLPASLLIVGDASDDPRGFIAPADRHIIPTHLCAVGTLVVPSDAPFADRLGGDGVPDLAVGRLPVATASECAAVVAKLIAHESAPPTPFLPAALVLDDDADFEGLADAIAAEIPSPISVPLFTIGSAPVADVRDALVLAWQGGLAQVHFIGHGSRRAWGAEEVLAAENAALLTTNRQPLVTAMNCLNAYFTHRDTASLGEALLLTPGAGAIAYWGPTAITSHLAQQRLASAVQEALAIPGTTIGEALRTGVETFANDPAFDPAVDRAVLDSWVLLGDPLTTFRP